MKIHTWCAIFLLASFAISCGGLNNQQRAVESITEEELKLHLDFIAADELRGRNTPSPELKITSRYLATMAEYYGLEPLLPDGSYLQEIPLIVSTIDEAKTRMTLASRSGKEDFLFPEDFGISGRTYPEGRWGGKLIFVGYGLSAPDQNWDDIGDTDLKDKVVIMLDVDLPDDHILNQPELRRSLWRRSYAAAQKGAKAVLSVVSEEREQNFIKHDYMFNHAPRCRLASDLPSEGLSSSSQSYIRLEIRQDVATKILGVSQEKLAEMFLTIKQGKQVPSQSIPSKSLEINLEVDTSPGVTHNVVAWLEGKDEVLKNEYVLFGSHHDHVGVREGKVFNGADDNGSGTVAMLELAQAMIIERPRRSVIFVWHTAEEKGLWGARYFVENSPVPVDKMSAELNMDMICRNDPNSLYLIGSNKLSSELDAAIHAVNDRHIHLHFDYKYEDPAHPDRFFFRSDQYPYIQYGIPGVWFFCGTTEDYHQETDTVERADFEKMARVTKLVYLTALEIGNKDEILKLDLNPDITTRGKHNLKFRWR